MKRNTKSSLNKDMLHCGTDSVQAFSDSQLVVSYLNGAYEAREDTMTAYV